jgi:hypothetical protein
MLPIQLVHHPEFYIEMESEDIELRGSVDESAGIMLKGSVVLNLNEVTKVKSITLNFTGKSRVAWTEGTKKNYMTSFLCDKG